MKNTDKVAATRSKFIGDRAHGKIEKPRRFDTRTFHALFHPVRESYTDAHDEETENRIRYRPEQVSAVIKKQNGL